MKHFLVLYDVSVLLRAKDLPNARRQAEKLLQKAFGKKLVNQNFAVVPQTPPKFEELNEMQKGFVLEIAYKENLPVDYVIQLLRMNGGLLNGNAQGVPK